MKSKRSLIILYLLFITSILTIIGITNSKKTTINIFTWNSNEMSIGKLINISFITGFTVSSIAALNIYIPRSSIKDKFESKQKGIANETTNESPIKDKYDSYYDRPPERDINQTQPTVSVSYRVVNESQISDSNDFQTDEESNDDWTNHENEW